MNELAVEVPSVVLISNMVSDAPINFVEIPYPTSSVKKLVKVNQISPRSATKILLQIATETEFDGIKLANPESLGLTIKNDEKLESRWTKSLKSSFLFSLISAITYGLFVLDLENKLKIAKAFDEEELAKSKALLKRELDDITALYLGF